MLRKAGFTLVLALSLAVLSTRSADAGPSPVLDAQLSTGVDPDVTAIGRLHAGGMLVFDDLRLAIDGHMSFSAFLRLSDTAGVESQSFSPLNLGVRYAFKNAKFHGPYTALGAGFGFLVGQPQERKVDDMETCATALNPDSCTFKINRQANVRLGLGWGFGSGKKTTVGVRLDLTYFAFRVVDGEDQFDGAPNPNFVPRPQATWAVMLGLEFMRWR